MSFLQLLIPKWKSFQRPSKGTTGHSPTTILFFGLLGAGFWWAIYSGSMWLCQKCIQIEDIGELLLQKVLSMAFLTFFSILIFSNLVTAFTTFFLSDDLQLLNSSPLPPRTFFLSRWFETMLHASWMIVIFGFPFLLAYGQTFGVSWTYYLQLLVVGLPFLIIPASVATLFALLLASLFSAKRSRDVLLFLFVIGFIFLYVYFRLLQPERFLTPEHFSSAVDFLGMLRSPTASLLPSDWAVASIFPFLSKRAMSYQPIQLVALYSTALATTILAFWFHEWLYPSAFSRAQEGRTHQTRRARIIDSLIDLLIRPFSTLDQSMLSKEFKTFTRNPGQWAQLLLLGALVVVYVFNFSSLRQMSSLKMHGISSMVATAGIYLFNLILLGFVVAAVSVRFAYPSVSLEGRSFWIIKQSPISMRRFLLAKCWSVFLPLFFMSELIVIATNVFIKSDIGHTIIAMCTVLLMTSGITSLGIGFGAIYPRFDIDNPAKIATGFGGVLYMICSIFWIIFCLALTLLPVRHLLWSQLRKQPVPLAHYGHMLICFVLGLLCTFILFRASIHIGARSLERLE
ncbi:MAG TPA: hypothetical protein DCE42_22605 [Myxococcales bacterium]|nr:hypothetical protein [Deltaproteobacteria bacterium]MBU54352.1 hypothetical protein [Deltaproteobacteria bacterium]HAA57575.1 hypothetical protein [Myxococcales bacterium]|tara:strand:+ start:2080 stop:3786 length:1707 start_codon:yes stop_codon:yes gene_type:complete